MSNVSTLTSLKKTASKDAPHATFKSADGSWTYHVLKVYQNAKNEAKNPYARWMCYVTSPFTFGGGDMGDTYVKDVTKHARLVAASDAWNEAYNTAPSA